MSKRLTKEQLITMEKLTGKEYTVSGVIRKKPRTEEQSDSLQIPRTHHNQMKISLSTMSTPLKEIVTKHYRENGLI